MVYVGEGDNVGIRISSHNKDDDKDFWEHACVITSKDLNLTKAHARYLESEIIRIVKHEGRATLANKSEPEFDRLPESDLADMDDFVARLQVLLPVLGAEFLRPTPDVSKRVEFQFLQWLSEKRRRAPILLEMVFQNLSNESRPEFRMNAGGLQAEAVEIDGQMIILSGSQARAQEAPSLASNVRAYRDQLLKTGKLVKDEKTGVLHFAEDVAFTSPSAAAQAVMGTSRNGRTDWINVSTNETYANWQERMISKFYSTVNLFDDGEAT
ncbi:GIY-YIG nuclease family protein [Tardiphaga sp. 709]|uniref:GIY-YIG nuclease family protein n=1 Tax=Tardiphaga sp. 709 TaxID=3076039 RepID=UPI0028E5B1CE|nr:GIY-YIG nuclease family protein [Tardiphaga sp. 709]WNV08038.1 GIY-YIG nuclease family protein [Tardiphaga sp. 709]